MKQLAEANRKFAKNKYRNSDFKIKSHGGGNIAREMVEDHSGTT